jgi:PAS domain S-box-containing protein
MKKTVKYEEILDNASVCIFATDSSGVITFSNRAACSLFGLNQATLATSCPRIADINPVLGESIFECLETGRGRSDFRVSHEDITLNVGVSIAGEPRSPRGTVCCLRPAGADAAVELESCRTLNRELQAVFESSPDGIWVCDGNGRVISINSASERLNGVDSKDIIGKHVSDIMGGGFFDRSVTLEVLETHRQVSIIQSTHKTSKSLLVTGTPVFDALGNLSMVVVNERDITQLNLIREQLEQSRMVSEKYREELAELSVLELEKQDIITENTNMRKVITAAFKLANLDASNILLLGESGTGKGLLAKFIHKNGKRFKKPFIQINCAALPESLLEAELFGYERGAFTGARTGGKAGLFELAQEGTLFLDEIGDLPPYLQAKLLKYLDDFQVLRLGSLKPIKVDCAVIAATNQDLEKLVGKGHFRRDLYYRLNTFTIHIPPLRERSEDVFELVRHFLNKYNRSLGMKKKISPAGLDFLLCYSFPGNVRELKNMIKRAVFLSEKDVIDESLMDVAGSTHVEGAEGGLSRLGLPKAVMDAEKTALEKAIALCKNTRDLARYLGVSQPTVVRKLRKHGLSSRDSYKNQNSVKRPES